MADEPTTADLTARLAELRDERDKGQQMLANLDAETAELRAQLLRIGGAIQVLEELIGEGGD